MRVLICGSRNWKNAYPIMGTVNSLPEGTTVITGGARGADTIAHEIATERGLPTEVYEADWSHGKKGGPIRNKRMLDEGKPDKVYAFRFGESKGTANMIKQAQDAGVEVEVWNG